MRKRTLTPVGRALFIACTMLVIVLLAFVGLARLAADVPPPVARVAAPTTELVAGQVEYDRSALASERRQDVIGALLTFFLIGGAACGLACAIWAVVLAVRGARRTEAALGEEAFGPR
jgi:hypothetical protein